MKSNKLTIILAVLLLFTLTLNSCALLDQSPLIQPGQVVTTSDNIKPDFEGDLLIYPREQLPVELQSTFTGDLVVAPKDVLKDESKFWISLVPSDYSNADTQSAAMWGVFDILKVFIPGLAGVEAILTIFSPRKRLHYAAAVKSIVPYNGNMDISGALVSVAKAMGLAHTDETNAKAAEVPPMDTSEVTQLPPTI